MKATVGSRAPVPSMAIATGTMRIKRQAERRIGDDLPGDVRQHHADGERPEADPRGAREDPPDSSLRLVTRSPWRLEK